MKAISGKQFCKLVDGGSSTRHDAVVARMIVERTDARIDYLPNPRNDADLSAVPTAQAGENDRFLALGLEPITLSEGLMEEVTDIAGKYVHRCDRSKIPGVSLWRASPPSDAEVPPPSRIAKATQGV